MGQSSEEQIEVREKNQASGMYDALNQQVIKQMVEYVKYQRSTTMAEKLTELMERRDKAIAASYKCGFVPVCPKPPKSLSSESGHYQSVLRGFEKRLNNYIQKLNEFAKSSKLI